MACPKLTDNDFAITVISVVKMFNPGHTVKTGTRFAEDLGDDNLAKRQYWDPIRKDVEDDGCSMSGDPGDFEACTTVQNMIDSVKKNTTC